MLQSKDLLLQTNAIDINLYQDDVEVQELLVKYNFYKEQRKKSNDEINSIKHRINVLKNEEKRSLSKYEMNKKKYIDIIMGRLSLDSRLKVFFLEAIRNNELKGLGCNDFNKVDYNQLLSKLKSEMKTCDKLKLTKNSVIKGKSNSLNFYTETRSRVLEDKEQLLQRKEQDLREREFLINQKFNKLKETEESLKRETQRKLRDDLKSSLQQQIMKETQELQELEGKLGDVHLEEKSIKDFLQLHPDFLTEDLGA